jgi:hypothetical protein
LKTFIQKEIPKRKPTCSIGQEPFLKGMDYYSYIEEDEKGKWLRNDFCSPCWEKFSLQKKNNDQQSKVNYWKSKICEKPFSKEPLSFNEKALKLLATAILLDSQESNEEAFILALYLARNKKLAMRKEIDCLEGTAKKCFIIYEVLATEELLLVPKLQLSQLQVEKTREILALKLKSK